MDWTEEQRAILEHSGRHARVQAGPGTGKSTVLIELAGLLATPRPDGAVRLATFTRAAMNDLAHKALAEEIPVPVTTVHSMALSILVHNTRWARLPLPLRIPDEWESHELIHADLRDRLSDRWKGLRRSMVDRLEREMAAQWESMDETRLVADIDPELRDAYIAAWRRQRETFGYSLFAEMPWYALDLVEDHDDADLMNIEFLIVDEYQDLNRCEIRLLEALSTRGIDVFAVGDEDQSIYSWRMAAPEGIRNFEHNFTPCSDYFLSESQRCARTILDAAQRIIGVAPGRSTSRRRLSPAPHNPEGMFAYLQFPTADAERSGVVQILRHYHESEEIDYTRMAILTRADFQHRWSNPIRLALDIAEIPYTDVESILEPLHIDDARRLLAVARLSLNRDDDLAWWTLLKMRRGIPDSAIRALADAAWSSGPRRFHEQLMDLEGVEIAEISTGARNLTMGLVHEVSAVLDDLSDELVTDTTDWVEWLHSIADRLGIPISDALDSLLTRAGEASDVEGGIPGLLAQLEPVARDLALDTGGVSIMSCGRSKGLTFDVVVTVGVEHELFPHPLSTDHEEERRLLYVAVTRARLASFLTMASYRSDGTSFSGGGDPVTSRSRCEFLSQAGIRPENGPQYIGGLSS